MGKSGRGLPRIPRSDETDVTSSPLPLLRLLPPWLCAVLALYITSATAAAAGASSLPPSVRTTLDAVGLPPDALALAVLPVDGRFPRWLVQAERPMQPGSTMKLVTTAVALDLLGPNHRGSTELLGTADVRDGVLQGDLILRGGADPELGLPQLWALLGELRRQGVREIAGDVLIDRTLFRPARADVGLPPFDEAPEFPYNGIPDALQLDANLLEVELQSDGDGRVRASPWPPLPGVEIDASAMVPSARRCADWDEDWQSPPEVSESAGVLRVTLRGGFPVACSQRARLHLLERLALNERQVRWVWQTMGGVWTGRARESETPPQARLLARRQSRPWGEVLRTLNKHSDNPLTRLLYLQLGVPAMAQAPQRNTADLSADRVRQWFTDHGIDTAGLVLDNGSGLSRSERITPLQLARLLQVAWRGPHAPDLLMSLPVAGTDGTMRNRLKQGPATGWARLKTGTLRNAVALAGYVRDTEGHWWVMAAMVNHDEASRKGRPVLDALAEEVARHGARLGPRPASVGPHGEGP
jgi:D-alanyl-D-alanine carboxypeptidase/D-alanyl-D-alanine-endopeptidase (penicillin-binding protein 4)